MFVAPARSLAEKVSAEDLTAGCLYPSLTRVREVSASIAAAVARVAWERGLATKPRPEQLESWVASQMYQPVYPFR
jgi:malate dehydrogenase (oxaloacetate-decarboxylating)(NADP+)